MVTFVGFRGTLAERFERKTIWEPNSGCLLWIGSSSREGYGYIWEGERKARASHTALRLAGKQVPDGMFVLHRCDNPYCVNTEHLFVGSHKDNMADMVAKGRHNFSNLVPGCGRLSDEVRDQVRELFHKGFGQAAASKATGINRFTINNWFREWRREEAA